MNNKLLGKDYGKDPVETIKHRGSDYAMVHSRLKRAREDFGTNLLVDMSIEIFMESYIIARCTLTISGNPHPFAVGHAIERPGDGPVNKSFFVENAETSALGRALACAGYGIDGAYASHEEMKNVRKHHTRKDNKNSLDDEFYRIIAEYSADYLTSSDRNQLQIKSFGSLDEQGKEVQLSLLKKMVKIKHSYKKRKESDMVNACDISVENAEKYIKQINKK